MEFIDRHKDEYGVEPICVQLTELGCKFAPSTYYEARGRKPSARAVRDEKIKQLIVAVYDENYRCYGARKMWLRLRQAGHDVARCTVERLMRVLGLHGARRGTAKRTTIADPHAARAQDLVGRRFAPLAPNRLWVADFTYDTRYFAQQWCHDCNQPCTRLDRGGLCPHCDEPVTLNELLNTTQLDQPTVRRT